MSEPDVVKKSWIAQIENDCIRAGHDRAIKYNSMMMGYWTNVLCPACKNKIQEVEVMGTTPEDTKSGK